MSSITQTISTLPTAPARSQAPATFSANADAFVGALPTLGIEINTVATQINTVSAELSSLNAVAWVSGTTYAIGDVCYSPANKLSYRRTTAGAGTTDPSADTTNWTPINWGVFATGTMVNVNSAVASVDFLNLNCEDLILDMSGVVVSTTTALQLATSTNNGTSWSAAVTLSASLSATPTFNHARLLLIGLRTMAPVGHSFSSTTAIPSSSTNGYLVLCAAGPVNAIRITPASGTINDGNFTPMMR